MFHAAKVALCVGEVAAAHRVDRRVAARLATTRAQDMGPSFIKLGQLASTRADLLPREYSEEFGRLRDCVKEDEASSIRRTVCESFGVSSVDDVFSAFCDEPIASASVAQVHRATMRDTGREVAVKVVKRGVRSGMEVDVRAARAVASAAGWAGIADAKRVMDFVDNYSVLITGETDMQAEESAARCARESLVRSMGDDVIVPEPITSRTDVIVMEYVPSVSIVRSRDPKRITSIVMETVLSLIASGGCFHRDPHEGNMGVAVRGGKERLVLYDFGSVARMSRAGMRGMMEAGVAFQMRDSSMLADTLIQRGLVELADSPSECRRVLVGMINQCFEYVRTMDIRSFDPSRLDRMAAHKVTLSEEINSVMRAVTMAEGVCKSAYPMFDLQTCIDQYIAVHGGDIALRRGMEDLNELVGDWL